MSFPIDTVKNAEIPMKRHQSESLFFYLLRWTWVVVLLSVPLWMAGISTWMTSVAHYEDMGWYCDFQEGRVVFIGTLLSPLTWISAAPALATGFWMWRHAFTVLNIVAQSIVGLFYVLPYLLFSV